MGASVALTNMFVRDSMGTGSCRLLPVTLAALHKEEKATVWVFM